MENLNPELLAIADRNGYPERLHYGWACHLKGDKVKLKKGDINNTTFLRSVLKPLQMAPILNTFPGLTSQELAIMCASHTGSKKHLRLLKELLTKFNIKENQLLCGAHDPIDGYERKRLIINKTAASNLHNNCSGKHTGMILYCKLKKHSKKNYTKMTHPLQKEILRILKSLCNNCNIFHGIDGCGVPTYSIPIKNICILFNNFCTDKKYKKIVDAMKKHPYLIGGINRIDSEIITASNHKLLSKVGADGLIIVNNGNESLTIKIADGSQEIRSMVVLEYLLRIKWITKKEIMQNTFLSDLYKKNIYNLKKEIVGKIHIL